MAAGQGIKGFAAVVLLVLFLKHLDVGNAAVHIVGDELGWTFNVSSWPIGKTFHAGDLLAFNYSPSAHNVAIVDKVGYSWCLVNPIGATVLHSGKDQIKLHEGDNFFISTLPGQCQLGMKLFIHTA